MQAEKQSDAEASCHVAADGETRTEPGTCNHDTMDPFIHLGPGCCCISCMCERVKGAKVRGRQWLSRRNKEKGSR